MRIEDIKDEEGLRTWLAEQGSYTTAVTIAARVALRVLPGAWSELEPITSGLEDASTLPLIWAALASSVSGRSGQSVWESETADAAISLAGPATELFSAAYSVSYAAGASRSGDADGTVQAVEWAARVFERNPDVLDAFWSSLRRDAYALTGGNPSSVWTRPLWLTRHRRIAEDWSRTREAWQAAGAPWDRFAQIYEDFWQGRDPDWAHLEQIVLIDPKVWEAGPKAVAEAIAELETGQTAADNSMHAEGDGISLIEVEAVEKQTDIGEAIVFRSSSQRLISVPDVELDPYAFDDILDRLDTALENLPTEGNQVNEYRAIHEAADRLAKVLQTRRDRPVRIFQVSLEVLQLIEGQAELGNCPPIESDPVLKVFCRELYAAAASLQAHDTHVRRFNNPVLQERLKEVSDEQARSLAQPVAQIVEVAEGVLSEDGKEAIELLEDPGAEPIARRNAVASAASWITRSYGLILRSNTSQTIQLSAAIYTLEPVLAPYVKWFFALFT